MDIYPFIVLIARRHFTELCNPSICLVLWDESQLGHSLVLYWVKPGALCDLLSLIGLKVQSYIDPVLY